MGTPSIGSILYGFTPSVFEISASALWSILATFSAANRILKLKFRPGVQGGFTEFAFGKRTGGWAGCDRALSSKLGARFFNFEVVG